MSDPSTLPQLGGWLVLLALLAVAVLALDHYLKDHR